MKFRQLIMQMASGLSAMSLRVGVGSVAKACWWWFAQPKIPQGMEKFTKEQ
ncbi:MAG: cyclic lactone autoinducer peptide [Oscillospiraceae bacterium]|nr:cyclic lactone autoinducer peptide [Oscillospiraceae bacterium]